MLEYILIALALVGAGFIIGRWYRQPTPILPVKQDNERMNQLQSRILELEAICADIHASTVKSTSGTARMVARKAAAAFQKA